MMDPQTQSPEVKVERRRQGAKSINYGWYVYLLIMSALLVTGYFIANQKLYKSGDDLGYNIGLVGGIMLLSMLFYPFRKRVKFMKQLGILPTWFKWHMIFGILGPTVILYHANFSIRSINAGVALICMLLVAGSGVFGRFFYTKIHHGLYGRQSSLRELQSEVEQTSDLKSTLGFAPEIQLKLAQFRKQTSEKIVAGRINLLNSILVEVRSEMLFRELRRELKRIMHEKAGAVTADTLQSGSLEKLFKENSGLIHDYLKAVRHVAQFHTYQELFSWWHILHIPLVYMLVFSGIFHVISVHMY